MRALAAIAAVAIGLGANGAAPAGTTLRGFTPEAGVRERATESRFGDIPSAQNALEAAAAIEARAHAAGSTGDYALAVTMRDALRADGLRAELESFSALVDTPRTLLLQLLPGPDSAAVAAPPAKDVGRRRHGAGAPVDLELGEPGEPSDPATTARGTGLPFNAGSGDGDVRAPLVYGDRGRDADYDTLAQANVDVRGAVILLRYGAQDRAALAERAQTRGAAGVIFYSDPLDDGAARGPVYPNGPWRPSNSIARGFVGTRIHIPVLPVSAVNAQTLLGSLRGAGAPRGWGGAMPVAYPLARGPGGVHLVVKLTRKPTTLWNTIGVIPGTGGSQSVVLGAHRDAWVYGVAANGGGIITLLEVARGLGALLQGGWRPLRSIVIAGWDGGTIGQAGSRAYSTSHRVELDRGCIAYLNADTPVTGPHFAADATAAIAPVVVEAAQEARDPAGTSTTVYDRWAAQTPGRNPRVPAPAGAGDDGPFFRAAGIPSASDAFTGPFGVADSSYDTLRYARLASDPDFSLHRASAQLYGLIALRLADANVVPYSLAVYAIMLRGAAARIAARTRRERGGVVTSPLLSAINAFALAAARSDALVARATLDISDRELRAARLLDSLVYGTDGGGRPGLPGIDRALDAGDFTVAAAATAQAVDTLWRTTELLNFRAR